MFFVMLFSEVAMLIFIMLFSIAIVVLIIVFRFIVIMTEGRLFSACSDVWQGCNSLNLSHYGGYLN